MDNPTPGQNPAAGISALAVDDEVLKQFWDLASVDQAVRQGAVKTLVQRVTDDQKAFAQKGSKVVNGDTMNGSANVEEAPECSPLTKYTMRRLVRGLASNRQGARQGFALALTHLVQAAAGVNTDTVLVMMESTLAVSVSMKASEARDNLLGQLFGCAAIVRANTVQDLATASKVVTITLCAAAKKVFLREVAAEVVLDMFDRLRDEVVMRHVLRSNEAIRALLQQPVDSSTPEGLLLAMRLWPLLPPDLAKSCPLLPALDRPLDPAPPLSRGVPASEAFASCDGADEAADAFFTGEHLAVVLPLLRTTTAAHPRLHQLWPSVLALLLPGFSPRRTPGAKRVEAQRARPGCLEAFWSTVVESDLFASSNERKYLGFQLFSILLPHLRADQVPAVFSPCFLRTLTNHRSSENSHLHSAAKRCISRVTALRASSASEAGHLQAALAAVLSRHPVFGSPSLAATSQNEAKPSEDIDGYVAQLQAQFLSAGSAAEGAVLATARPSIIEQLCGAARLPTAGMQSRAAVRRLLAVHALFEIVPGAARKRDVEEVRQAAAVPSFCAVSPEVRELCACRLVSLLGSFHSGSGSKAAQGIASKAAEGADDRNASSDGLPDILQLAANISGGSKAAKLAMERDPSAMIVLDTLQAISIPESPGNGSDREAARKVASLRHLVRLLTMYEWLLPRYVDLDTARDLSLLCNKALQVGASSSNDSEAGGDSPEGDEEAETPWSDALLDILLAQIARPGGTMPSAPLRDAVDAVFAAVSQDLTPTGLQDMMRVLNQQDEGAGTDADLLEAEGADDDEDMGEEEEGDEGPSDEDSSSGSESDEDEGQKLGRLIDQAQAQTGSDSDVDELDDEDMAKMDGALVAAVRAMAQPKPVERKQQMHNFKLRVAALLEVYIKRNPGSPHLPGIVPGLLSALERANKPSGSPALSDRIQGVLAKLVKSKAAASGKGLPDDDVAALLKSVLFTAARATHKRNAAAAASSFIYLLHVAQGTSATAAPQVVSSLRAALSDFFGSKKSRLTRPVMEAFLRAIPCAAASLLPHAISAASSARTSFLKVEAFALVTSLLRSPKDQSSRLSEALNPNEIAALVTATLGIVTGEDLGKTQRHVDALKGACRCWEAAGKLLRLSPTAQHCDLEGLRHSLSDCRSQGVEPRAPKVQSQMDRLAKLVSALDSSDKSGKGEELKADSSTPGMHAKSPKAKVSKAKASKAQADSKAEAKSEAELAATQGESKLDGDSQSPNNSKKRQGAQKTLLSAKKKRVSTKV